jgi:hypothetical protein
MVPIFEDRGALVFQGEGYAERTAPAVSRSLAVDFGELVLEGYQLSEATLQPGGQLEVSLAWRAGEDPRPAYTVFLHLLGSDGERVAQVDELLLKGYYQPTVWPADKDVIDRHVLDLPDDLAPGRYWLEMGLYRPGSQDIVAPLDTESDRVVLDTLAAEGLPAPTPETPFEVNFGGQIELSGYTLDCATTVCDLLLYWRAPATPSADYAVFVHLVAEDGQIASQHDGKPVGGRYPTSMWKAGEVVEDEHSIPMASDLAPGDYRLLVGLYQPATGERLPVLGPDGQAEGDSALLATVPIP